VPETLTRRHGSISIQETSGERTPKPVRHLQAKPRAGHRRKWPALFIFILLSTFLCGCHVWKIQKSLSEVRQEIQGAETLGMEEAALYHLDVARSLLAEAEEQYEQADFRAAAQFLSQSERQLEKAQQLHALNASTQAPEGGSEE
jgi:hypothetical protein